MPQRVRKFIGAIALIVFVVFYVMIAAMIGDLKVHGASWPVQTLYFMAAGLAWVPAAGLLIRWMHRPERS